MLLCSDISTFNSIFAECLLTSLFSESLGVTVKIDLQEPLRF